MKSVIYLGAAIAFLRAAAALLSNHDDQEPMIAQYGRAKNNAEDLAASTTEHLKIQAVAQMGDSPNHDAVLVGTEELDDSGDAGPYAHHSHKPKFHIGSSGSQWAITYIPYNDDLTCKSPSAIQSDVSAIAQKGFTTVRLYATDCSALTHIGGAAHTHKLNLILGIHIDDAMLTLASPQLDEIISWASGNWDLVSMIVIGNEAIFNEYTTASALASYLNSARALLRAAGYTGPVTTTEPISILYTYSALLCRAIDVAAANIHPFFHAEISAEMAGDYVADQLAQLERICPGLEGVNLETGWPRRGRANGEAVPGDLEQRVAVTGIMKACEGRCVVLGFGDDGWKDEGEFGVEGSWGCGHLFGDE